MISLLAMYGNAFATTGIGNSVNTACVSNGITPFTGSNCAIYHNPADPNHDVTPGKAALLAGGTILTYCFCPTTTCTDSDGDTFAVEGDNCGAVDCDDTSAIVLP